MNMTRMAKLSGHKTEGAMERAVQVSHLPNMAKPEGHHWRDPAIDAARKGETK